MEGFLFSHSFEGKESTLLAPLKRLAALLFAPLLALFDRSEFGGFVDWVAVLVQLNYSNHYVLRALRGGLP
jgi:hypothetical protein